MVRIYFCVFILTLSLSSKTFAQEGLYAYSVDFNFSRQKINGNKLLIQFYFRDIIGPNIRVTNPRSRQRLIVKKNNEQVIIPAYIEQNNTGMFRMGLNTSLLKEKLGKEGESAEDILKKYSFRLLTNVFEESRSIARHRLNYVSHRILNESDIQDIIIQFKENDIEVGHKLRQQVIMSSYQNNRVFNSRVYRSNGMVSIVLSKGKLDELFPSYRPLAFETTVKGFIRKLRNLKFDVISEKIDRETILPFDY